MVTTRGEPRRTWRSSSLEPPTELAASWHGPSTARKGSSVSRRKSGTALSVPLIAIRMRPQFFQQRGGRLVLLAARAAALRPRLRLRIRRRWRGCSAVARRLQNGSEVAPGLDRGAETQLSLHGQKHRPCREQRRHGVSIGTRDRRHDDAWREGGGIRRDDRMYDCGLAGHGGAHPWQHTRSHASM